MFPIDQKTLPLKTSILVQRCCIDCLSWRPRADTGGDARKPGDADYLRACSEELRAPWVRMAPTTQIEGVIRDIVSPEVTQR